jgi:hypothetical protein
VNTNFVPKPVSHDLENRSLAVKAAEVKAAFQVAGLADETWR